MSSSSPAGMIHAMSCPLGLSVYAMSHASEPGEFLEVLG